MKATTAVAVAALNALRTSLSLGKMYYFAGAEPATAGEALDMAAVHTQVVVLTVSGAGTGLTFDTATTQSLNKAAAEVWSGQVTFSGFVAGPGTLTPTFFRMGAAGDNCRTLTTAVRIQGTIGGPASAANIKLGDGTTVTDNGSNTRTLPIFSIDESFLA